MKKIFLISTELVEPFEPVACQIRERVRSNLRDDFAIVDVNPPINREVYDTEDNISELILATRHKGSSLFQLEEWPKYVYICKFKKGAKVISGCVRNDDIMILDWGEIYPSKNDAIKALAIMSS